MKKNTVHSEREITGVWAGHMEGASETAAMFIS